MYGTAYVPTYCTVLRSPPRPDALADRRCLVFCGVLAEFPQAKFMGLSLSHDMCRQLLLWVTHQSIFAASQNFPGPSRDIWYNSNSSSSSSSSSSSRSSGMVTGKSCQNGPPWGPGPSVGPGGWVRLPRNGHRRRRGALGRPWGLGGHGLGKGEGYLDCCSYSLFDIQR